MSQTDQQILSYCLGVLCMMIGLYRSYGGEPADRHLAMGAGLMLYGWLGSFVAGAVATAALVAIGRLMGGQGDASA